MMLRTRNCQPRALKIPYGRLHTPPPPHIPYWLLFGRMTGCVLYELRLRESIVFVKIMVKMSEIRDLQLFTERSSYIIYKYSLSTESFKVGGYALFKG